MYFRSLHLISSIPHQVNPNCWSCLLVMNTRRNEKQIVEIIHLSRPVLVIRYFLLLGSHLIVRSLSWISMRPESCSDELPSFPLLWKYKIIIISLIRSFRLAALRKIAVLKFNLSSLNSRAGPNLYFKLQTQSSKQRQELFKWKLKYFGSNFQIYFCVVKLSARNRMFCTKKCIKSLPGRHTYIIS